MAAEHHPDIESQRERINDIEDNIPDPNDYEPTDKEKLLLAIMADEGRTTARVLRMRGGFGAQYVSEMCQRLNEENWLWRVKRPDENSYGNIEEVRGYYQYNAPDDYDALEAYRSLHN